MHTAIARSELASVDPNATIEEAALLNETNLITDYEKAWELFVDSLEQIKFLSHLFPADDSNISQLCFDSFAKLQYYLVKNPKGIKSVKNISDVVNEQIVLGSVLAKIVPPIKDFTLASTSLISMPQPVELAVMSLLTSHPEYEDVMRNWNASHVLVLDEQHSLFDVLLPLDLYMCFLRAVTQAARENPIVEH